MHLSNANPQMSNNRCHGKCPRTGLKLIHKKQNIVVMHSSFVLKCCLTFALGIVAWGHQVCRQIGSCLYNGTAAVWVYCVCADLWDSNWKRCENVWVVNRRGGWESKMMKKKKSWLLSVWVVNVGAAVRVCECACTSLWQQHSVITTPDCWLLVLHGLWRCTWEATHTCPGPAWVLNWFTGYGYAALSRSHSADYLFPCFIMF